MIESSPKQRVFFFKWLFWHYFEVPKFLLKVFGNFLIFNFNYFSIEELFTTLFSHWRKYQEFYPRGFEPGTYFMIFMGNMISRFLGAIVRTVTILIGLLIEILILILSFIVFFGWLFLPFIFLLFLFSGIQLLISF
jgi:hypothetical protein